MALSDEDVREILRLIDESKLDELRIETSEFKLHVLRGGRAGPPEEPAESTPEASAPEAAATAVASTEPAGASNGARTIEAPMLGTFYRASAPGEQPFVDVGSTVGEDTVVCLIEVMKMMNSIKAGMAGTVVEVCADNAQLVEYGEPLFRVDPAA
jgi:acetyl-CoA carboxylase biotin carboxyl carrier protein